MTRMWATAGLAVQVLLTTAYVLLSVLELASPETRSLLSCLLLLEAALLAAGYALLAAGAAGEAPARSAWRLLAVGCVAWSLAQSWWTWLEVFDCEPPTLLGAAGLGYAALPVLALPALHRLVARGAPAERSLHRYVLSALDLTALAGPWWCSAGGWRSSARCTRTACSPSCSASATSSSP